MKKLMKEKDYDRKYGSFWACAEKGCESAVERRMTVTPIEHEQGRFFVSSQSRTNVTHIVDLQWSEERWQRPRPHCSCEESFCKGHVCKHILATVNHEKARLNL